MSDNDQVIGEVASLSSEIAEGFTSSLDLKFDYSVFEEGAVRNEVMRCVLVCKMEFVRTAEQIVRFGAAFNVIQEKTGAFFDVLCAAEFPEISKRTVQRYVRAAQLLGRNSIIASNSNNIDLSALYRVAEGDEQLRKEVELILEKGEHVSKQDVQEIIQRLKDFSSGETVDMLAKLNTASEGLRETQAQLEAKSAESARLELEVRRLNDRLSLATDAYTTAQAESVRYSEEIGKHKENVRQMEQALIEKDKKIATVEVEVVPKGYSNLEDAIAALKKKINTLELEEAAKNDLLANKRLEIDTLDSKIRAINVNTEKVTEFVHAIETVVESYPTTLLAAILGGDATLKPILERAVASLRLLASNIEAVVTE